MERQEQINYIVRVFTYLIKKSIADRFVFPGGGLAHKTLNSCLGSLEKIYMSDLSEERLLDYCICQVFAMSDFSKSYIDKWKASHSFGKKAIERFCQNTKHKRFFEDKWLDRYNLSRLALLNYFGDKKEHPLAKFIYPEYEEITKKRLLNLDAGFYICQLSTLLWTPFSGACRQCRHEGRCREITKRKYEELYRIREKEYQKTNRK
ncbi:hypothetical protein IR083_07220 [Dysgonomonas sp. GY75]|uniref:hypothetical protein n=1 Tax=Dysgonomonas sp. GY75 TaxID=2780419 RepID=UPI001883797A|nr:hypothetical protein [Dysgonomonas sp. GY75]MBF0648605.1 hypothetical protein [Dysgonomonas sp. GY75]